MVSLSVTFGPATSSITQSDEERTTGDPRDLAADRWSSITDKRRSASLSIVREWDRAVKGAKGP